MTCPFCDLEIPAGDSVLAQSPYPPYPHVPCCATCVEGALREAALVALSDRITFAHL